MTDTKACARCKECIILDDEPMDIFYGFERKKIYCIARGRLIASGLLPEETELYIVSDEFCPKRSK